VILEPDRISLYDTGTADDVAHLYFCFDLFALARQMNFADCLREVSNHIRVSSQVVQDTGRDADEAAARGFVYFLEHNGFSKKGNIGSKMEPKL
jgi:hypothetical protein